MRHTFSSTCLSNGPHENRVSDPAVHFNGCLPAAKQRRFFESLPPESQQRITRINGKILELRNRLETTQYGSTAGAWLRDFKRAMAQWRAATGIRPQTPYAIHTPFDSGSLSSQTSGTPVLGSRDDSIDSHVKASVIYFKNGQPCDAPGLPKTFPCQKVSVADLLSDDDARNPVLQRTEDTFVRYFHLPANNMVWVEGIIARYYREKPSVSDGLLHGTSSGVRPQMKTEMILQHGYWQGQQNFDADSEIHARHMRPFFSPISVEQVASEPNPRNMVLFMPYLHWETDRTRAKRAEIIKEAGKQNLRTISDVVEQAKQQFSPPEVRGTAVNTWVSRPAPHVLGSVDRRRALAGVLRAAAMLVEAMDLHIEEELAMKYLHARPPLHPRRTLDQSYYGALRNTEVRDRDQVVYRGTSPQPHDCTGMNTCPQCNEDIRKTPRLIMVDQLWMWILDDCTVITSFPRRWGRNRPDPSAIHKSLRTRLQCARTGEILSAYDLALVIVDETSRVFFDRTKTSRNQPNLVELFTAAIRDLTYKQTAAFDQFLIYTRLATSDYKRQRSVSSENSTQNNLLNINPEGELLKEVKDIVDELHIMMRIKDQQQAVMEAFVKHIRRSLAPLVRPKHVPTAQVSTSWDIAIGASLGIHPDVDERARLREELERQNAKRTLTKADNLLLDINERTSELQTILKNAQNTSAALKDLLTLKQQQASVIEAREAVKQAQLTLKQGQSIMIFTIVTIIFLPLSFCASVFGMNATELNAGLVPLSTEFGLIFPISAGITLASFLLAFSQGVLANSAVALVRSAVSFAWNTAVTWVLVRTGLYAVGREMAAKAGRLREREGKVTGAMKAEVLRREKNLEKMRAAAHVKELAKTVKGSVHEGTDRSGGWGFSPYTSSVPGSPSPFLGGDGRASSGGYTHGDVELVDRAERNPGLYREWSMRR